MENELEYITYIKRIKHPHSWVEHIPFVKHLISIEKPNLVVELGTHSGNSFCAFLEAIEYNQLNTKVYAIDTWGGDDHAGFYDLSIYNDLKKYVEVNYPRTGVLIKNTFEAALKNFEANSIDILHIDGFHSYEAVKNDYDTWIPKMKKDGIILFHDTEVYKPTFGVHKFWKEVSSKYKYSFNFKYGNGLGILSMSENKQKPINQLIEELNSNPFVNNFFTKCGEVILMHCELLRINERDESLRNAKFFRIWNLLRKLTGKRKVDL